jgi:hypothetical protein
MVLNNGIQGMLQAKVNATTNENKKSVMLIIRWEWNWLTEVMVHQTCCAFRLHLEKVDAVDGGYIG